MQIRQVKNVLSIKIVIIIIPGKTMQRGVIKSSRSCLGEDDEKRENEKYKDEKNGLCCQVLAKIMTNLFGINQKIILKILEYFEKIMFRQRPNCSPGGVLQIKLI